MQNFVESGDVLTVTLTADTEAGEVVVAGELAGVAVIGGMAGDAISVNRTGVYWLPKVTGALAQGENIYWKAADKKATKTATDNTHIGYAFAAAAAGDPEVLVVLKG